MNFNRERALIWLLRIFGATSLTALGAVVMPMPWMASVHAWLDLGEMPTDRVVEYLARSLSTFYALFGAVALVLSSDVRRYLPLVYWLGVFSIFLGCTLLGIDLSAGMPNSWTWSEGPMSIALGALVIFLARQLD